MCRSIFFKKPPTQPKPHDLPGKEQRLIEAHSIPPHQDVNPSTSAIVDRKRSRQKTTARLLPLESGRPNHVRHVDLVELVPLVAAGLLRRAMGRQLAPRLE